MKFFRAFLAAIVVVPLVFYPLLPAAAAHPAIGILTLATHAHLDEAAAFPGLSVFEGERLSTEAEGRLSVRLGHSVLTLGEKTEVVLVPLADTLHVDMSVGSLRFSAAQNEAIEVHVQEAIVRQASTQATQASVTILAPKVLQITAERGNLNFVYQDEFRVLPEGQTYRLYLDSPSEPPDATSVGSAKSHSSKRVGYFIVGAGVAGLAAWTIHDALRSSNPPISPAKP
ncbi:MAG: hypothetical protein WBL50_09300 [Candidatus Acidiferrum sp.]